MTPFRFRPAVSQLEDRTTPAGDLLTSLTMSNGTAVGINGGTVGPASTEYGFTADNVDLSPDQVLAAGRQADQTRSILQGLARKNGVFNVFTVEYLQTFLPTLSRESVQAAATLALYQNQLETAAGGRTPFADRISAQRFAAETNAIFAAQLANQLGGTAAAPVVPPTAPGGPAPRIGLFTSAPPPPTPLAPAAFDTTTENGLVENLARFVSDENTDPVQAFLDPRFADRGDGLRSYDIVQGIGTPTPAGGTVLAFYTGFLTDGTIFDQTNAAEGPRSFNLLQTIRGFQEGLVGLRPGGIRRLDIPAELGYGITPQPGIPLGSRLVFEVKLVDPVGQLDTGTGAGGTAPIVGGVPPINFGGASGTTSGGVGTGTGTMSGGTGTTDGTGTTGSTGGGTVSGSSGGTGLVS